MAGLRAGLRRCASWQPNVDAPAIAWARRLQLDHIFQPRSKLSDQTCMLVAHADKPAR